MNSVAAWTGQRKYDVHDMIGRLIRRCDALGLRATKSDADMLIDVTAFVTAVVNRVFLPGTKKEKKGENR